MTHLLWLAHSYWEILPVLYISLHYFLLYVAYLGVILIFSWKEKYRLKLFSLSFYCKPSIIKEYEEKKSNIFSRCLTSSLRFCLFQFLSAQWKNSGRNKLLEAHIILWTKIFSLVMFLFCWDFCNSIRLLSYLLFLH